MMTSLNILHLNTAGGIGGAFIAADRLHQALLHAGIPSVFAYHRGFETPDSPLRYPQYYRIEHRRGNDLEWMASALCQQFGFNDVGRFLAYFLSRNPFFQQASVLHFHNLHGDYFSYLALPRLTQDTPAVWTLHDMWGFTGHCAYSYDCDRWKRGCGHCPYPDVYSEIRKDHTAMEWKLKRWAYRRSRLAIVTPSRWLAELARQSMLNQFPIYHIPNGIDTEIYRPLDMEQCRYVFDIPMKKKVLLFGAEDVTDPRKGGSLLLQAIQLLPESLKAELFFIVFGVGGATIAEATGIPTLNLGYVSMERLKVAAFAMADLFVFPTRADNFPVVLEESLACGTPMVSCDVGGVAELVRPGMTGYLARPDNPRDICQGIMQLLEDHELRNRMRQNCRSIAINEFELNLQMQQYINLYHQLLYGSYSSKGFDSLTKL